MGPYPLEELHLRIQCGQGWMRCTGIEAGRHRREGPDRQKSGGCRLKESGSRRNEGTRSGDALGFVTVQKEPHFRSVPAALPAHLELCPLPARTDRASLRLMYLWQRQEQIGRTRRMLAPG